MLIDDSIICEAAAISRTNVARCLFTSQSWMSSVSSEIWNASHVMQTYWVNDAAKLCGMTH